LFSSTESIITGASYFETPTKFFSKFSTAFDLSRSQILKIETRQFYVEKENVSYNAMVRGDWALSMEMLHQSRQEDADLYEDLNKKGVDFIRCRPVQFPISAYIKWEVEVYRINSSFGERIFCSNVVAVDWLFEKYIKHDFMVFDSRVALIHNYDESGEIQGGWIIHDHDKIVELQKLFIYFKSFCSRFDALIK
jgi:hypothetical protein